MKKVNVYTLYSLTSSGKSPAFVSMGKNFPVSAGVQEPAEIPHSDNEVMNKQHRWINLYVGKTCMTVKFTCQ
jgi:helix-turn-helix protein